MARKREEYEVKIEEQVIEQVNSIKYLGVLISSDGSMEKEVEARIGSATRVIGGMNEIVLRRKELSRNTKLKVLNAVMMPTLMYGCESWSPQSSNIISTQVNALRSIEGVCRMDRVRNVDIKEKLQQEGVLDMVKRKARLENMSMERTTKKIF